MTRTNEDCETLAALQAYTAQYYADGGDECDDASAPWRVPATADVVAENAGTGELVIDLPSGERAKWDNTDREWVACERAAGKE